MSYTGLKVNQTRLPVTRKKSCTLRIRNAKRSMDVDISLGECGIYDSSILAQTQRSDLLLTKLH